MAIRIVTGGIAQETNTFQWQPTTLADFAQFGTGMICRGQEILDLTGTGTTYGGIIAEAQRQSVEVIPTTFGEAIHGGRVTQAAFRSLSEEILTGLRAALPVDGVLLNLHGAMALENDDDGEGALLALVRDVVGPDLPIVVP